MNKKIVGILVMTLLIATCLTVTANTKFENDYIELFKQEPTPPGDPMPYAWTSDIAELGWTCYDDFWDVTSPICDVHWWTISEIWSNQNWHPCNPEGNVFTITFYLDDGTGKPGDVVCSYENVMPTITETGIIYEYIDDPNYVEEPFMLYYFETQLPTCCNLEEGWISIVKTYSPNDCNGGLFESQDGNGRSLHQYKNGPEFWHNHDFAFMLTGESPMPDLKCEGSLSWNGVKPGETKSGSITVENIGESSSMLDWKVESYPNWGTWTFSPDSGDGLKPEYVPITISVSVVVPDDKNTDFTGNITVINMNDASDYEIIVVSLSTSKIKTIDTLLIRLLENYPLIYQLIQRFFKL
jgi:hypothetical protein